MKIGDTKRLYIVEAKESDIDMIMEIENHKDNRDFIWQGTVEQHINEINSDDSMLLKFEAKKDKHCIGYCLVALDRKSERFELRRIAITEKGKGYGREAISALIKYAFKELGMNKFWLDVYPDNKVGIVLYESLGLKKEGVLRQNYKSDRGYLDQIVYSMLRSEYKEF
ncbi:GNAT family N-acetyltransferase [Proteocatella sphenisci]|uniref:GNAT family N-acetyltransferase n=1 Tax=Proteocatella sphenisci TaxID=181070 RepID=UPI0004914A0F|nr:GNAT family protein [Proteocatella sphenisci]